MSNEQIANDIAPMAQGAGDAGAAADPLADTPTLRALYERSLIQYRELDAQQGRFVEVNGIRIHVLE